MDYIINLISQNQDAVIMGITLFITIAFYFITKNAPSIRQSAIISGLSQKAVEILLLIFQHTQYDHVKYNATLEKPVTLLDNIPIPEQKMKVAVQAINEKLPKSTLNKVGDLFNFAQMTYGILKPLFKKK